MLTTVVVCARPGVPVIRAAPRRALPVDGSRRGGRRGGRTMAILGCFRTSCFGATGAVLVRCPCAVICDVTFHLVDARAVVIVRLAGPFGG